MIYTKIVQFGSHSSVKLYFECKQENFPDTRVYVEGVDDSQVDLCWIAKKDIDNFTEDFKGLLKKYFI